MELMCSGECVLSADRRCCRPPGSNSNQYHTSRLFSAVTVQGSHVGTWAFRLIRRSLQMIASRYGRYQVRRFIVWNSSGFQEEFVFTRKVSEKL